MPSMPVVYTGFTNSAARPVRGWRATIGGVVLAPQTVDGYRQAFRVPPGPSGALVVEFDAAQTSAERIALDILRMVPAQARKAGARNGEPSVAPVALSAATLLATRSLQPGLQAPVAFGTAIPLLGEAVDETRFPEGAIRFLRDFRQTEPWSELQAEARFVREYKAAWSQALYPPVFVTVDTVIHRAGHVLLIERDRHPGFGAHATDAFFQRLFQPPLPDITPGTDHVGIHFNGQHGRGHDKCPIFPAW